MGFILASTLKSCSDRAPHLQVEISKGLQTARLHALCQMMRLEGNMLRPVARVDLQAGLDVGSDEVLQLNCPCRLWNAEKLRSHIPLELKEFCFQDAIDVRFEATRVAGRAAQLILNTFHSVRVEELGSQES